MEAPIQTIREFRTGQFSVVVDALPEYDCDLSWDDTGEVAQKINSGEYVVFCARARVIHDQFGEIASDYLGQCIYADIADFEDHRLCGAETRKLRDSGGNAICGSYFSDMVHTVCKEARDYIADITHVYVRG